MVIYRENHRKTIENWRLHQEEVGPMVCGRCMQLDERNQTQLITGGGTHCNWQYFHKDTTVQRDIYIYITYHFGYAKYVQGLLLYNCA